jgi:hypothetical protein
VNEPGVEVFIGGEAAGQSAKWLGRPAPHLGQMASPFFWCFFASWLRRVSAPFGGNASWMV